MTCQWLTPQEAAEIMQVTKASIYRWIRNGRLAFYHTPGGRIRLCKGDLMLGGRRINEPSQ